MNHLSEIQMSDAIYGEMESAVREHLKDCEDCQARVDGMVEFLKGLREYPIPERGSNYGAEVWARLLPQLPLEKPKRRFLTWWTLAPAFAALLMVAFVAGIIVEQQRHPDGISTKAQARVLLMAMSEHLERSQIVLAELVNGSVKTSDVKAEQSRARDLVEENRLLRQAALHSGDLPHAALLEELERALLNVANGPPDASPEAWDGVRRQIEDEGLLFKVRIASVNTREEGQRL